MPLRAQPFDALAAGSISTRLFTRLSRIAAVTAARRRSRRRVFPRPSIHAQADVVESTIRQKPTLTPENAACC